VLLPPVIFVGLVVGLYTWKSLMLVLFQNKIIYNPGLPPSARSEKIQDYKSQCGGIQWLAQQTRADDGTRIALAVTTVQLSKSKKGGHSALPTTAEVGTHATNVDNVAHIYILYFQGA
jgi:hypothetical protein